MKKADAIFLFLVFITILYANEVIRVSMYYNPPKLSDEKGDPKGFFVDLLKDWSLDSGYDIEFVSGSFLEHLENIKAGKEDLIPSIAKTPEREAFMDFTEQFLIKSNGIVIIRDNLDTIFVKQLNGMSIGIVKGDVYERFLDEYIKSEGISMKKVYYDDYKAVVDAVSKREIDAGLLNTILHAYYRQNDLGNFKDTIDTIGDVELFIGIRKGLPEVKASLDAFLDSQIQDKDSTYYKLIDRWFGEYLNPSDFPTKKSKTVLLALSLMAIILGFVAITTYMVYRMTRGRLFRSESHIEELNELLLNAVATFASMDPNTSNRVFFEKLLDVALKFIPEAESGCISIASNELWTFQAVKGYKESLYDLKIPVKYMIRAGEKAIVIKDISDYNRKELPEEYLKAFAEAGVGNLKRSLMVGYYMDGKYLGNISLDTTNEVEFSDISKRKLEYLGKIASQFFKVKQSAELEASAREEVILALVRALEAGDPYTSGHSARVAESAVSLGKKLNLNYDDLNSLKWAALLHDIGKIGVPREILLKTGKLNDYEFEIIRNHVRIGVEMLKGFRTLEKVIPIIVAHHERWDGKGYPEGLKGEEIPLLSRILSIVDAYDAMRSNRPYRPPLSFEEALEEIIKNAGTQFDPQIARLFVEHIHEIDIQISVKEI